MGHRGCLPPASKERESTWGQERVAGEQRERQALRASARSVDFMVSAWREATEGFSASKELGRV